MLGMIELPHSILEQFRAEAYLKNSGDMAASVFWSPTKEFHYARVDKRPLTSGLHRFLEVSQSGRTHSPIVLRSQTLHRGERVWSNSHSWF